MEPKHILVVEDEEDILELVHFNLKKEGYQVTSVLTGEGALEFMVDHSPDLIILDLMLPGVDGLKVCRTLKSDTRTKGIPIIMLTARSEEIDIVTGFELGADDYLTKPFSPRILIARVSALLRRLGEEPLTANTVLKIHEIEIHPGRHEVLAFGRPVNLTSTEFRILNILSRKPGWVYTRDQIVASVHDDDYAVTDRSVDVMIVGLRRKLGKAGVYIETVRGVGYRMKDK